MRTVLRSLPILLLFSSCGTLLETTAVQDDVYDIPDRNVSASVAPTAPAGPTGGEEDYYNEQEATQYQQGSYWDRTYNDPSWFNRDRFGFGFNSSPWGTNWGMSYGMGWGHGTMFNSPNGWYDPYWGNSWMSGYGYYNPWNGGMYDPWQPGGGWNNCWNCGMYGNNWGGWNQGWGNCWGCGGWGNTWGGWGNPWGGWGVGGNVIVQQRPSFGGGGGSTGGTTQPAPNRMPRSVPGLLNTPRPRTERQDRPGARPSQARPSTRPADRNGTMQRPAERERQERQSRPSRTTRPSWDGGRDSSPSFDRGGSRGGGGGSSPAPSPRPRR